MGKFQLMQEKIANMVQSYDAARLLYMRAGWLKNQGLRNTRETSLAKWFATDKSFEAASQAIQIHGAYGYSDEYEVERYLRNAKGAVIYEGTSEIHILMQAGYALGYRNDTPLRCELPGYDPETWQE
jgi:alkylation response protein AidB-like acyl-CoA dehydrogenase